ncbi:MAG TPA: hypothetical protein VIG48_11145 [Jatrophihabitans sp.]
MTAKRQGIGRAEIAKDTIQVLAESAAGHVGTITAILTAAVRDVAREIGDLASDVFEMRDAADRANQAAHDDVPAP